MTMMPTGLCDPDRLFREVARSVLAMPSTQSPYEWAKKHGKYVKDAQAFDYNPDDIPYTKGILDAVLRPGIRQITLMASEQMTKTEIAYKVIGYFIANRPGRMLIVYPNKKIGIRQNREKFTPTIQKTPDLARRLQKYSRAIRGDGIDFDRLSIAFANAPPNKPIDANLEAFDYLAIWVDEADRCHPDVLDIVGGRGKTRRNSLLLVTSTPSFAGHGIDREYFGTEDYEGSDRGQFWVPCVHPQCRRYHLRDFGLVRWPGATRTEAWTQASRDRNADAEMVEQSAWMRCPFCRERLGREHNQLQLTRGVWLTKGQSIEPWSGAWDRPTEQFVPGVVKGPPSTSPHAGFHLPGLLSCVPAGINPYGYVAKGFVAAKGKPSRHWLNRRHGTAHAERAQTVEIRDVQKRAIPQGHPGSFAKGIVPPDGLLLTAAVDVQQDHAYIEVVAWHSFARVRSVVWWGIAPYPPGTPGDIVLQAIEQTFPVLDGGSSRRKKVIARIVDSGDRTDETYDLCRRWNALGCLTYAAKGVGLKGGAESMSRPVEVTYIDKNPDGSRDERGLQLLRFNSFFLKGLAVRAMRGPAAAVSEGTKDLRSWSDPKEGDLEGERALEALGTAGNAMGITSELRLPYNVDGNYLGQITSEHLVKVGTGTSNRLMWLMKPGRSANHWFDCHVMNLALGERLGLRALQIPGQGDPLLASPASAQSSTSSTTQPQAQDTAPTSAPTATAQPTEILREEKSVPTPPPIKPPIASPHGRSVNTGLEAARERAKALRARWRN